MERRFVPEPEFAVGVGSRDGTLGQIEGADPLVRCIAAAALDVKPQRVRIVHLMLEVRGEAEALAAAKSARKRAAGAAARTTS
jgi:hypothetical protein